MDFTCIYWRIFWASVLSAIYLGPPDDSGRNENGSNQPALIVVCDHVSCTSEPFIGLALAGWTPKGCSIWGEGSVICVIHGDCDELEPARIHSYYANRPVVVPLMPSLYIQPPNYFLLYRSIRAGSHVTFISVHVQSPKIHQLRNRFLSHDQCLVVDSWGYFIQRRAFSTI